MLQGCRYKLVTILLSKLWQTYWNNLATSLIISTRLLTNLLQDVRFLRVYCSKSANKLSSEHVVFTLLVPSCQQVWNKLLTCNNLVDIIRLVARLFQQVRYSHDITILLQPCVVNLVTFLLYHDCIRLVRTTLLQV
jgi:hypothetical protein